MDHKSERETEWRKTRLGKFKSRMDQLNSIHFGKTANRGTGPEPETHVRVVSTYHLFVFDPRNNPGFPTIACCAYFVFSPAIHHTEINKLFIISHLQPPYKFWNQKFNLYFFNQLLLNIFLNVTNFLFKIYNKNKIVMKFTN